MKTSIKALASAVFLCLLASCAGEVHSVNPLTDPEKGGYDERLRGVWLIGKDDAVIVIGQEIDNRAQFGLLGQFSDSAKMNASALEVFTSVLNSGSYMNISNPKEIDREEKHEDVLGIGENYVIYKYEFPDPDIMLLRWLDEDKVKDAIKSGRLKGEKADSIIQLTDTRENIAAFVESDKTGKLFKPAYALIRLRLPEKFKSEEDMKKLVDDFIKEREEKEGAEERDK